MIEMILSALPGAVSPCSRCELRSPLVACPSHCLSAGRPVVVGRIVLPMILKVINIQI